MGNSNIQNGRVVESTDDERPADLFDPIEDAIAAIAAGEIVVVVDDEDRENEGDLIMAAEFANEQNLTFFVNNTSGVICAPITEERAEELDLPPMVTQNTESMRTAFTVSVDYRHGTTTGISAGDRALTIKSLVDDSTVAADLARPGHIFPLVARPGGVLKRAGHTEAAVDLAMLAGLKPAGVLCEIVNEDGSMARRSELVEFSRRHGLKFITIAELIKYRRRTEKLVQRVAEATIPTRHGPFRSVVYESLLDEEQHIAFVRGAPSGNDDVLVRVHSECLTGDIFGSLRCDCGAQLDRAMALIAEADQGVIVYLRGHEGRGIGLGHKIRAYGLQEVGYDTVDANLELGLPADSREYGIGAQILVDLGLSTIHLLTNNPAKYGGIAGFGLEITGRVPLKTEPTEENLSYLRAKQDRMGHLLELDEMP